MKRLAFSLLFFALGSVPLLVACPGVDTQPAPDGALPECEIKAAIFCTEAAPGAPACSTDEPGFPLLEPLPRGKLYAPGCTINYVGIRDPQGDCTLEAVCKCVAGDTPVTPVDSGTTPDASGDSAALDAGDDADAAPTPTPDAAPPPARGAHWLCAQ